MIKLADVQNILSKFRESRRTYNNSVITFDQVLQHDPAYTYALNGKASSLRRLADLETRLSQYDVAQQKYKDSVATFDILIQHASDGSAF